MSEDKRSPKEQPEKRKIALSQTDGYSIEIGDQVEVVRLEVLMIFRSSIDIAARFLVVPVVML